MAINEITLESRIDNVLKTIFPTFRKVDVVHQLSFTLKFGHHVISINGAAPTRDYARAISDVLIKVGDKNLILLELKKENLKITDDDIGQGLSYARLIHPMPPLTLISNGSDNLFFDTYTKEKLNDLPKDLKGIEKLIDNGFRLALADRKEIIDTLLNNDSEIIMQILNNLSKEKFERLSGPVNDLTKPISEEFSIKREIVSKIEEKVRKENVVAIIGGAFCGKTNVLYQFFKSNADNENGILFIDCKDLNYSLFQHLSNQFSKAFEFPINQDKVREWFISSLSKYKSRMILVLDNLQKDLNELLKSEITEIIDLFKGTTNVLIFSADALSFNNLSTIENRSTKTLIGTSASVLEIKRLNDTEFTAACEKIWLINKAVIQHGGHKTSEYREPRTLRHISAMFTSEQIEIEEGQGLVIQAIPDFSLLESISKSAIFSSSVRYLFKKYSEAFLLDGEKRKKYPYLNIAASGSGAMSAETAKKVFGSDYNNLLASGLVSIKEFDEEGEILFPKTLELLSYYSIGLIKENVEAEQDIDKAYNVFLDQCTPLPYSDIVGSQVLSKVVRGANSNLGINLIGKLLNDSPKKELIGKGTKVLTYADDIGHLRIDFNDDLDEGGFVTNFLPYVILSQFLSEPFLFGKNNEEPSILPYLRLLREIGSTPLPLIRMYALPFQNMQSLTTHNFKKFGEVISGTEGIIEPIVQSIHKVFHQAPELIEYLYKDAISKNNFQLLWRIYLAIRNETMAVDQETAQKATAFMKEFNKAFPKIFAEILTQDIDDETERERIRKIISENKPAQQ